MELNETIANILSQGIQETEEALESGDQEEESSGLDDESSEQEDEDSEDPEEDGEDEESEEETDEAEDSSGAQGADSEAEAEEAEEETPPQADPEVATLKVETQRLQEELKVATELLKVKQQPQSAPAAPQQRLSPGTVALFKLGFQGEQPQGVDLQDYVDRFPPEDRSQAEALVRRAREIDTARMLDPAAHFRSEILPFVEQVVSARLAERIAPLQARADKARADESLQPVLDAFPDAKRGDDVWGEVSTELDAMGCNGGLPEKAQAAMLRYAVQVVKDRREGSRQPAAKAKKQDPGKERRRKRGGRRSASPSKTRDTGKKKSGFGVRNGGGLDLLAYAAQLSKE